MANSTSRRSDRLGSTDRSAVTPSQPAQSINGQVASGRRWRNPIRWIAAAMPSPAATNRIWVSRLPASEAASEERSDRSSNQTWFHSRTNTAPFRSTRSTSGTSREAAPGRTLPAGIPIAASAEAMPFHRRGRGMRRSPL